MKSRPFISYEELTFHKLYEVDLIGLKKLKFWNIWGCPSPACFTPSVDYGGGEGVGKIGFFKLVLAISDFFKDQNPELIF